METKATPARGTAWGILNPYGDLWTHNTFQTEAEAAEYIRSFWKDWPGGAPSNLSAFRAVPVKVTVSYKASTGGPRG